MNKEKIYIGIIIFLGILTFYFAFKATRKIEVRFSKPAYPFSNFIQPDRQNIWEVK